MKTLNITKERFEKSKYFTKKYGKLECVSESEGMYKTEAGKLLKFSGKKQNPKKPIKSKLKADELMDDIDGDIDGDDYENTTLQ